MSCFSRRFCKVACLAGLICLLGASCAKQEVALGSGPPEQAFKNCMNLLDKNKYEDSVQCLEMFKAKFPDSPESELAELKIGDAYFRQKDYLLAAESYEAFIKIHPYHEKTGYAHYRAGSAYAKEAPKAIDRDQSYLENAMAHLRQASVIPGPYQELAQREKDAVEAKFLRREFYIGRFYYRKKEYLACRPRLALVVEKWPKGELAGKSLYYLVMASIALEDLESAKHAFTLLEENFRGTKWHEKAQRKLLAAVK